MQQDYSFWEQEAYTQLWDVCIIGSGITGISTGISILERNPSLNVVVVDRWFLPLGASTRNAGFACFGSPSEILEDIKQMGEEAAIHLVQSRWDGLQKLLSRLDLSSSQYETCGGYEVYRGAEYSQVVSKLPYLNELLEHALERRHVFSTVSIPSGMHGFEGAVFNPLEGQLHPGFMMRFLTQKFISSGGKLLTGLQIDQIDDEGEIVSLRSRLAVPLQAGKVIVTTNAFARHLLPELDVHGARNHVMVTSPLPFLSWKGCVHFDKGFYYFRNIGNRILLGGARNVDMENENTASFGMNPLIVEELEHFLYTHLASRDECNIEFRWSGIIGIGSQKKPIIKRHSRGVYIGVRLSGMGIALASLIGEELAKMVLQQDR